MPFRTHLYARLTHKYVPGWADEDNWVPLTPAKFTGPTLVSQNDDGDFTERREATLSPGAWACAQYLHRRHAKEGVSLPRWLAAQIGDNLTSGCRCEHDCCGHLQVSAYAQYLGQRRFSVEVRHYRNV